jgi:hypothetical protein
MASHFDYVLYTLIVMATNVTQPNIHDFRHTGNEIHSVELYEKQNSNIDTT